MFKATKKSFWMPSMHALNKAGGGGGGGGGTMYIASPALNADDASPGFSFRIKVPLAINALTQARVTIRPGTVNSLTVAHASIGKWDSASSPLSSTTATPLEFLFSGAAGFTSKTTPQTSDWLNISSLGLTTSDYAILIYDLVSGSTTASQRYNNASTGVTTFYQSTPSYNVANVAGLGFTDVANTNYCIDLLETQ